MAAIPAELKAISPYLARANELEKAEPVISYWCTYYALQQAMSIGSKDSESQVYLFELMDKLESTKAAHASEDAFTDDVAAAAYIENFGLKLFSQADNEDREAKATRLTARKFLAAANFLELLAIFGEVATEASRTNRDRIKYAKWKAAEIAKAFREGRTPTPGPAGGLQEDEEDATDPSKVTEVTAAEAKELSKEFEALDTGSQREEPAAPEAPAQDSAALSPVAAVGDDAMSFSFPQQVNTEPSAPPDEVPDFIDDESDFDPASLVPTRPADPTREESTAGNEDTFSAEIAPASHQTAELPLPHAHLASEPPAFPSAVFPSAPPSLPSSPPSAPTHPSASINYSTVPAASAPPAPARPAAPAAPPAAAPPVLARKPDTFDPMTVGDVQKHARWAISALNYEDFETARKELRLALAILGE